MTGRGERVQTIVVLALSSLFLLYWFSGFLSYSSVVSVDLPGHVALIERLVHNLSHGTLFFFDPWWFSGWPAYQYYGFLGHLLTASLVPILLAFSSEPVRLTANVVLLAGCASLPISVYWAAVAFHRVDLIRAGRSFSRTVIALYAVTLSYWFLNLPLDLYGIGAASLWHGGLYLQIFAWHFSVLLWGALVRLVSGGRSGMVVLTTLLFTALILTHLFAAVFSGVFFILCLMRFSEARLKVVAVILLSFGLTAFWWLPMVATAGAYTYNHSEPPQGELLELIVRQPLGEFLRAIGFLARGKFVPVDLTPILIGLTALFWFSSKRFWQSSLPLSFAFFGMVALWLFSSPYLAGSLPAGLHYYRFMCFLFLFLVVLISGCAGELIESFASSRFARLFRTGLLILCLACCAMTSAIGMLKGRAVSRADEKASIMQQHQVLTLLGNSESRGRVAFEYFRDRAVFSFLSPHFLEARLAGETGRETINGLFIQSSLSVQFAADALATLGIDTYRVPAPWTEDRSEDRQLALERLRDSGVSELVGSSVEAMDRLAHETGGNYREAGPYRVLTLQKTDPPLIELIRKRSVIYRDDVGDLPFKEAEMLFLRNADLYRRAVLVDGKNGDVALPDDPVQLVRTHRPGGERSVFYIAGSRSGSGPVERFRKLREAFEREVVPGLVRVIGETESDLDDLPVPGIRFSQEDQQMHLDNLIAGELYRVAYSYSPYWRASGARIFRAAGEQILVAPESPTVLIQYGRSADPLVLSGMILSCAALAAMLVTLFWAMLNRLRRNRLNVAESKPGVMSDE